MLSRDAWRQPQPPAAAPDDELAELSDTDFYRQLRKDVEGVAAGIRPRSGC